MTPMMLTPKTKADAASKDDSIESVADEDDSEDIRPVRKPAPPSATRFRKLSKFAKSCWCKSSKKNAATRARP